MYPPGNWADSTRLPLEKKKKQKIGKNFRKIVTKKCLSKMGKYKTKLDLNA